MATIEDIETLRERLLLLAKTAPPPMREKKGSKAAALRALYPDLLAIQKQIPHASYADLTRMLKEVGLDVSADSVRKVMHEANGATRPDAKRTVKTQRKRPVTASGATTKADTKAEVKPDTKPDTEAAAHSAPKPAAQTYTPDQMQHAGIRRRDKRV